MSTINATKFPCTDAGNAELLGAEYKHSLRYDHGRGRWLIWSEHWWAEDKNQKVLQLAKRAARLRYSQAKRIADDKVRKGEIKWARQSESKAKLEAALALAQSERTFSTTGEEWDSDPWLLGVSNGVVDLRTGRLHKGKQSDLITMHTEVSFDANARCPRFEQFASEIFCGNEEMIQYVQRAAGHSLTGDTSEQCLFACCGMGANGKSTFLRVMNHVLGGYAYNAPFSAFELRGRSSITNDVAPVGGKRFVTAIETSESAELNEARIKALTGCDPVTARYLYRENFTFVPVAKFWLAFNHKPAVSDDSLGFWRRVRVIPFEQQFVGERADPELLAKLIAEAPGILAWCVRGCLAWQKDGLRVPPKVEQATQSYREENDPVGEFISDRCVVCSTAHVTAGALWEAFQDWSAYNGDRWPPLVRKTFTERMEAKGFKKARVGHDRTWVWRGLRIRLSGDGTELVTGVRADADARLPIVGTSEESCIKQ